jgi:hypothetical protein
MPHLIAAGREGKSLNAYARSRGLAPCTLYAARQLLQGRNGRPIPASGEGARRPSNKLAPISAFARVALAAPVVPSSGAVTRLQARLPNGVVLEVAGAEAALLTAVIQTLARQ